MQKDFLAFTIHRFKEYKKLGDATFGQLREDEFHFTPSPEVNSIAVIIKHMHGNMMSRWTDLFTSDGEKEMRDRDGEFLVNFEGRDELLHLWEEGWTLLFDVLQSLSAEDLVKTVTIRQQPLTVTEAILRQLAHYSYHIGQIVMLGKWQKDLAWKSLSIPRGFSKDYKPQ